MATSHPNHLRAGRRKPIIPVINPITARYIAPFRFNANRQRYDKFGAALG
jgi:hypothetical protein